MQNLAHVVNTFASYGPDSAAIAPEEQVIVTPCEKRAKVGVTAMHESAFAARCAFSWRHERVRTIAAGSQIAYAQVRQIACFRLNDGMTNYPRVGDRITRSWDGATFEIRSGETDRETVTVGVVEMDVRLH